MEHELKQCRICQSTALHEVIDLGQQVITSRFPIKGELHTVPSTRIRLVMCDQCRLVQLKDTTNASEMYEHLYGYRSGISQTMRDHLRQYNQEICEMVSLTDGDHILDIGSNDSTFLSYYPTNVKRIGCDPTGKQFSQYYSEDMVLIPTYFTEEAIQSALGASVRFKVVSSISMFYDLPNPVQFAKDIHSLLDVNGIWTLEQSYVATMLERNSIDTICHEHLEYYGLRQIKEIMDRSGFKIIRVTLNECNGGSFRIFVCKQESTAYEECTTVIQTFLENEEKTGIHTHERYTQFYTDCLTQVTRLKQFIEAVRNDQKKVYIYGASTKGNCLLQFGGIDSSYIPYAVERNPLKYGRTTSTGIEIISEEQMRQDRPEFLLVLPWHFRDEIIRREDAYLEQGGGLLFPFPHVEVYTKKPRCLITGIHGQIGHYVTEKMKQDYYLIGIQSTARPPVSQLVIRDSLHDYSSLESFLLTIRPRHIVHLASITNTEICETQPIDTIQINGVSVSYFCEIIRRHHVSCSLFHASSSELYRGHIEYEVTDNDRTFHPTTIYGISKLFGHQIVDYYRTKYHLPFSNGVIFTTESPLRKQNFLLQKIIRHASTWHSTHEAITLGSINSFRNLIHASDVADAIDIILRQSHGDNYVICNLEEDRIRAIVERVYRHYNINLMENEQNTQATGTALLYDRDTGLPVATIGESLRGMTTHIQGLPTKLLALGWKPSYSIDDMLKDMFL